MKKITKKEQFMEVKEVLEANDFADLAAFIENEIALLDKKAAKAKETAANKKAQPDELADAVYSVLTGDLATIADIVAKVDLPDVTNAKVSYRLNALVADGKVVKDEITIPGVDGARARKVKAFKLAD